MGTLHSKFCDSTNILLFCLPPHSSHLLQPVDVGFFSPMKSNWKQAVAKYQLQNPGTFVNKTVKRTTLVQAFKQSGIYPVDRRAISSSKFGPSQNYMETHESNDDPVSLQLASATS